MLKQIGMMSLLATGIVASTLPAAANTAVVQDASQGAIVSGNNNQVNQVINQTTIYNQHPGRGAEMRNGGRRGGNSIAVQESRQSGQVNRGRNVPPGRARGHSK
ncbi:hypothetical protein GS597_16910 [Synechococcales cyanobacterium C]|uniref:Uncharacterized protein n=1 Tax=Petrachloros mirabilis ULC683 TaxID=2781853 RepID=A0A8K2A1L3_9CYAN|nr:hypothetical protein [Petrachloros mirabilis]NCJ08157.1 hypothetical protein [Petrachloros mirabilis ULC683]